MFDQMTGLFNFSDVRNRAEGLADAWMQKIRNSGVVPQKILSFLLVISQLFGIVLPALAIPSVGEREPGVVLAEEQQAANTLSFVANYDQLPERLQTVYDDFYERVVRYEKFTVDFAQEAYSYEDFHRVLVAMKNDHPELWLFLDSDESVRDETYNGHSRYIDVFYDYLWRNDPPLFVPSVMNAYLNRIDRVCDRIIAKMPKGLSRLEQYRFLCDELCARTTYKDEEGNKIKSFSFCYANGPLLEGEGLCQAYAQAYQWLCHRAGLPCVTVDSNPICHTWNLVELENGDTYHVDATWYDECPGCYFMFTQEEAEFDHCPNDWAFVATGKPLK